MRITDRRVRTDGNLQALSGDCWAGIRGSQVRSLMQAERIAPHPLLPYFTLAKAGPSPVTLSLLDSPPMPPDEPTSELYQVVINHEEQYSIWPAHREQPPGWRSAGKSGTKEECLAHIKEVWTDMRPLSLRRSMDGAAR